MEKIKNALIPAKFVYDPYAHNEEHIFADNERVFQGIPGIEVTSNGTVYYTFYTGTDGEHPGNFVLVYRTTIDKLGSLEQKPYLAVVPTTPDVRCFDEVLWIDPQGRLWLFWAQSWGNEKTHIDGRFGTWAAVCDDPDEDEPKFSEPRRIANGIMMNKPCVTKDGDWLLPCAIWKRFRSSLNSLPEEMYSNVYLSEDSGESFRLIGRADYAKRTCDEPMIVEGRDGRLMMFIRGDKWGIGLAYSDDGGRTWYGEHDYILGGPDSRFFIRRLKSGNLLMVNHHDYKGTRCNLKAMISTDEGESWQGFLVIDERKGAAYPDGVQADDGKIYIAHDYNRTEDKELYLSVFTEEDVLAGKLVSPDSRLRILVNKATGTAEKKE